MQFPEPHTHFMCILFEADFFIDSNEGIEQSCSELGE